MQGIEDIGAPLDSDEEMDMQAEALDLAEEQVIERGPLMRRVHYDYTPDASKHRYACARKLRDPRTVTSLHCTFCRPITTCSL